MTMDYFQYIPTISSCGFQYIPSPYFFVLASLLIIELLFYYRLKYLEHYIHSNVSMFDTKPSITNERREHLLKMAAKYATLHDDGMKGWASQWFAQCPFDQIHYDNATELLSWAFMLKHYQSDKQTSSAQEWSRGFLRFAMKCIESITEHSFKKGYNPHISFVRNSNDAQALSTTHRPFIFYFVLLLAQWMTDAVFIYILRFEYKIINGLKVWYKIQSDDKQSKPILLVHGLGVHYMPYIPFIYKLMQKSTQNDVICIEIPWTVMSIWHFIPKRMWNWFSDTPSPSYIDSRLPATKQDFVHILQHMEDLILNKSSRTQVLYERTDRNALKLKWTLIGHSYGSFIVSGIYDYIKGGHTRCIDKEINLPRLVLMDPVTLCLTQATTVSFVALTAKDWPTYLMQHLASRELMIGCTLTKYFHWFEYAMFPDDLINAQVEHVVATATSDTLIPNKLITKGIEQVNEKRNSKGYQKIHQILFENMHHAVWLLSMSRMQRIVDAI
eukprot:60687_1